VDVPDETLRAVAMGWTSEAGVRNLERQIGALLRHAAMRIAEGTATKISIDTDDVATILGARRFENEVKLRTSVPGVATGLAWTPVGGDILFIEATLVPGGKGKLELGEKDIRDALGPQKYIPEMSERTAEPGVATGLAWTPVGGEIMFVECSRMPGKGGLMLTGQLGDVMKESAQAALSYVKSHLAELGLDPEVIKDHDLHVHVPAGAIPKDGPSAGVAMIAALTSLLARRCVRSDVAMTGEITLRGLVLPVGGIKEKMLAAHRAGIKRIVLPERNEKDVVDVPEEIWQEMDIVYVKTVGDALAAVLEEAEARAVPTETTMPPATVSA
jgi:ATP-dependent Lon protease